MTNRPRPASVGEKFENLSKVITQFTGSTTAFGLALGVVIVWMLLGPFFKFSDTWQLVINTGTTIITFLMVFLIQRTQNKDALAIHLKLNELVAAMAGSSNRLIEVEALSEHELMVLREHYSELAKLAKAEADIGVSHSIDEARIRHTTKQKTSKSTARPRPASTK